MAQTEKRLQIYIYRFKFKLHCTDIGINGSKGLYPHMDIFKQIMTIWKKLSVVKCEMEQLVGFVEAASLAGEL